MASETDICNFALAHLGETRISDISDTGNKAARLCALLYPQARDEVLSEAQWSCAKAQEILAKDADPPTFKWLASYELPGNLLRLVEIEGESAWLPKEYFDIQGSKLLIGRCEEDTPDDLNIEYIYKLTDTTKYSPLLVDAITYKLAAKLACPITGSDNKAQEILNAYERQILPKAQTRDSAQTYSGKNHPMMRFLGRGHLRQSR